MPTSRYQPKPNRFAGTTADVVWGAAAYGYRMNNHTYNKSDHDEYHDEWQQTDVPASISNRSYAYSAIKDPDLIEPVDYELAEQVRNYFRGLTFKAIVGNLNDFEQTILSFVDVEDWAANIQANYHFAALVALPASYHRGQKREAIESRIREAKPGFIGTVGERLTLQVEVIKTIFSERWNTYYSTAITPDDHVLFFAYKGRLEVGQHIKIAGTVKAFRDENNTQFNRVKLLKEK